MTAVAVITDSGLGLGAALARGLKTRGVQVVMIGPDVAAPGDAIAEYFTDDISDAHRMRKIAAKVEGEIGPVSILINAAAIHHRQDFLSTPAEDICHHIQVNLCGYINVTSAFLPFMVDRGRGRIVNVVDESQPLIIPGSLGYAVAAAGVHRFSEALALELWGRMPGITATRWIPGHGDGELIAQWGVQLALQNDIRLHGGTVVQDRQILPRRSLRRRVADIVLMKPPPRPIVLGLDQNRLKETT